MKGNQYKVLLISGSLRQDSTNTGLLRAIEGLHDPRFQFEWASIKDFPVFDQDIEAKQVPLAVKEVRQQIRKNDAILFAVPEYNFTIASPLKNAYDWLSRQYPSDPCPVAQKIAGMVSSAAAVGGDNAQRHFNQSVKYRKLKLLYQTLEKSKRIQISRFNGQYFDGKGNLINEDTRQRLREFLDEFAKWISQNRGTRYTNGQTQKANLSKTNDLERKRQKKKSTKGFFDRCF